MAAQLPILLTVTARFVRDRGRQRVHDLAERARVVGLVITNKKITTATLLLPRSFKVYSGAGDLQKTGIGVGRVVPAGEIGILFWERAGKLHRHVLFPLT
jgi:hypothetical protein